MPFGERKPYHKCTSEGIEFIFQNIPRESLVFPIYTFNVVKIIQWLVTAKIKYCWHSTGYYKESTEQKVLSINSGNQPPLSLLLVKSNTTLPKPSYQTFTSGVNAINKA